MHHWVALLQPVHGHQVVLAARGHILAIRAEAAGQHGPVVAVEATHGGAVGDVKQAYAAVTARYCQFGAARGGSHVVDASPGHGEGVDGAVAVFVAGPKVAEGEFAGALAQERRLQRVWASSALCRGPANEAVFWELNMLQTYDDQKTE